MNALFEIVKSEMRKHRVTDYHTDTLLIAVEAATTKVLQANNDFYFFANAFSEAGIVSGRIQGSSGGNALNISPLLLNTKLFKYQMFKGNLSITNNDADNQLFVELYRVTPIVEIEKESEAEPQH